MDASTKKAVNNIYKKHARRVENKTNSQCDLCGEKTGSHKYLCLDHTACKKSHMIELIGLDVIDDWAKNLYNFMVSDT